MKEVVTKFLLIIVAVAAVVGFVYGSLWKDTKSVSDGVSLQIKAAYDGTPAVE